MPLVACVGCLLLGSGLVLFVLWFLWCLVFCVGGYAYLTGGCALLPYARFTVLCICHLLFCTVCAEITGISVSDFFYYVYIQDRAFELNRPYQRKKMAAWVVFLSMRLQKSRRGLALRLTARRVSN